MRTEAGYGACSIEGKGLAGARIEVGTAYNLHRSARVTPQVYVERIWTIGESSAETLQGLGNAARLRRDGPDSFVIVAASDDRHVQVIANGVTREAALALTEAALSMPLTP